MEKRRYLLGQWKQIDGYEDEQFIPYKGPYENWSYDEQELIDLKAVLGNGNLEIIKLGRSVRHNIDLSEIKEIKEIE